MTLDDLFEDSDFFGSQDSFFHGSHFKHHMHNHRNMHAKHNQMHNMIFENMERHSNINSNQGGNCKTVTQRVGNMVTQYTTCS